MRETYERPDELASLLDEAACRRLIRRYPAAVDWADREALTSIFWPDAKYDFGRAFFIGSGQAGIEFLLASVNASLCRTHNLGTTWLAMSDDTARAETPAVNVWISRNPDESITRFFVTARYLWQLQKRHGEWRVSALQTLMSTAQCTRYDLDAQPPGFALLEGLDVSHTLYPGSHVEAAT
jgi:hypothetical protein